MTVPEAAVHENHGLVFRKYYVRSAGITFVVFPEPEAPGKEIFSDLQLRSGILALDAGHIVASYFLAVGVHTFIITCKLFYCKFLPFHAIIST